MTANSALHYAPYAWALLTILLNLWFRHTSSDAFMAWLGRSKTGAIAMSVCKRAGFDLPGLFDDLRRYFASNPKPPFGGDGGAAGGATASAARPIRRFSAPERPRVLNFAAASIACALFIVGCTKAQAANDIQKALTATEQVCVVAEADAPLLGVPAVTVPEIMLVCGIAEGGESLVEKLIEDFAARKAAIKASASKAAHR